MSKNRKFKTKLGYNLYKIQRDLHYAISDNAKRLWTYKKELGIILVSAAALTVGYKAPDIVEHISFEQSKNRVRRAAYYEEQIDKGAFSPEVAEAISKQIEKDREDFFIRLQMRAEKARSKR